MRSNRRRVIGPIPARAGEPASGPCQGRRCRAYPRSRGGTSRVSTVLAAMWGLSPLARGNPDNRPPIQPGVGPIPARAGEPRWRRSPPRPQWAYPRSRGGTRAKQVSGVLSQGLSPLARGNRLTGVGSVVVTGPIPARAGEPPWQSLHWRYRRAYPRSRGGTLFQFFGLCVCKGLSPLARGNRGKAALPA